MFFLTITENVENNGTEKIGLVTPTLVGAIMLLDGQWVTELTMEA